MKQKPLTQRIGDFMEGKGFYIVLFLCVSAIGISGYYLFSGLFPSEADPQPVTGNAQVEVTTPKPTKPPASSAKPTPAPEQKPAETLKPSEPAPKAAPTQSSGFTWPVNGTVNRDFSLEVFSYDATMGDWRTHSGLDITATLGTEVMAAGSGTVSSIVQDALMGTTVTIDHGDGLVSVYSNLAELPTVTEGTSVTLGTVIGAVGATAISESADPSHLHFEIHQDGVAVDPTTFLEN